jgi:M6 family metalloprotease-like protein
MIPMQSRIRTVLFLLSIVAVGASAAPLTFLPQVLRQPDGGILNCFASGDEFYNWLHDKDGFTIIQDQQSGYYVYARLQNEEIVPTSLIALRSNPASAGLQPWIKLPPHKILERRAQLRKTIGGDASLTINAPSSGTLNNIVVFIRFSDDPEYSDSLSYYDRLFNAPTGNSMQSYFKEVSYEKISIATTFYPSAVNGVVVSYKDAFPRAYYQPYSATNTVGYTSENETLREFTLLENALNAVKAQIPPNLVVDADSDGYVDNVCFIVYGSTTAWATLLWPHMWSLYTETVTINGARVFTYNFQIQTALKSSGVGVLCHEMFHSLGSPDLYHYNHDGISPMAGWDIMETTRNPPQHMTAHMKLKYGKWIDTIPEITATGTYSVSPLTSSTNNSYRIRSPYSAQEYFVVEYRKRTGTYESSLQSQGLLVYRINTLYQGNAGGPPDEVYVYRVDGTRNVNGAMTNAVLSSAYNRTALNDYTNPKTFLTDGSRGGLNISTVGPIGSTISFTVTFDTQRVAIMLPKTNDLWPIGATKSVQWKFTGAPRPVLLDYSTDNGATWSLISINALSPFSWTVPNTPSNRCKIRVKDYAVTTIADSMTFAICPPFGALQFNYNATTVTGATGNFGVVYLGTEFWTSRSNGGSLHRWNKSGGLIEAFNIPGITDVRSMAFDGTAIYMADGTKAIYKINPSTKALLGTMMVGSMAAYCTYDPTANNGAGGLWYGDVNTDIVLVSLQGAELSRISYATHQIPKIAGIAFDNANIGKPYLWVFSQNTGAGNPQYIYQLALPGGTPTNVFYDVVQDVGSSVSYPLAGGLSIASNVVFGKVSLCGILSGTPNRFFGYDLPGASDVEESTSLPNRFLLEQNYPNPFNPSTTVRFSIAHQGRTTAKIYDVLGREIYVLTDREYAPGTHTLSFDASMFPAGVYFCRLVTGSTIRTIKMSLLK